MSEHRLRREATPSAGLGQGVAAETGVDRTLASAAVGSRHGRRASAPRSRLSGRAAALGAVVSGLCGMGLGAVIHPIGGGTSMPVAARTASERAGAAVSDGSVAGVLRTQPGGGGLDLFGPVAAERSIPAAPAADFRPVPVPVVVDRDTVGPLWLTPEDRAAGVMALDVPETGPGDFQTVPGSMPAPGQVGVRLVRVEVERDLPVDGARFAETVMASLNDPRGWGATGELTFARTDGPADTRVVLASPGTVDAMCAPLETESQLSCRRDDKAILNFRRWVEATPEFADRTVYRQYLVNHEVGHVLGHPHEQCPGVGQVAPVMQQQSIAVAPCRANGWPFP